VLDKIKSALKSSGPWVAIVGIIVFLGLQTHRAAEPDMDPLPPPPPSPQALELVAPAKVNVGELFVATYTGGAIADWLDPHLEQMVVHVGRDTVTDKTYSGTAGVVITAPGRYSIGVGVIEINGGRPQFVQRWQSIIAMNKGTSPEDPVKVKPDAPLDPPPVKPEPIYAPPPLAPPIPTKAEKVIAVIVEDDQRTPAQGRVIMDKEMRARLAADGHRIVLFSTNDPAYKTHGYNGYVADVGGPPAVLIFDASKTAQNSWPLTTFALPKTAADLERLMRKAVKK
jgi:hypothetical protein